MKKSLKTVIAENENILKEFLEEIYELTGKQRQFTAQICLRFEWGHILGTFIYPDGDRVVADRKEQREAKEAVARRKMSRIPDPEKV